MRTITVYAYHYFEILKTKIEISSWIMNSASSQITYNYTNYKIKIADDGKL